MYILCIYIYTHLLFTYLFIHFDCRHARQLHVHACLLRKVKKKNTEQEIELPYYELERLYSGTPAGRQMLADLVATQKGKEHPDKKATGQCIV